MKKRKGNLYRRMMAFLLSAVLIAGTSQSAFPIRVLAKESVSENTMEITGEEGAEIISGTDRADYNITGGSETEVTIVASGTGWTLDSTGKLTISSNDGMSGWCNKRSENCEKVTSVEMDNSVTFIGYNAFNGCSNLKEIAIPDGVTEIDTFTFQNCSSLESVTIPSGVKTINTKAFDGCSSLETIDISGVTRIGDYAFQNCSSLTAVVISDSAELIWNCAFKDCRNLESVTMQGSTPPELGTDVFSSCKFVTDNTKGITVPAGATDRYKVAVNWRNWADYITDGTEVTIVASGTDWTIDSNGKLTIKSDNGMTDWIKSSSSDLCQKVISVEIEAGVISIGRCAFGYCKNLKEITIPDSVESMEESVFLQCKALESITIPDSVTSIGTSLFEDCSALTSVRLPDNMKSIPEHMFAYCRALKSITIPDSVTDIGNSAFMFCSALESITIPDIVTDIRMNAFLSCSSLTEVRISNNLTNIEQGAFGSCSKLKNITIPSSVTSIGHGAFNGCGSLERVTMQGSMPPTLNGLFESNDVFTNCKFVIDDVKGIEVPEGAANRYKEAWPEWADYITDVTIVASGTDWTLDSTGKLTFSSDDGMKDWCDNGRNTNREKVISAELKAGVSKIADNAFYECRNLTGITILGDVESIGKYAFYECRSLNGITIPDSVTSIGERAFEYCEALTAITIPENVTSIGGYAFTYCEALTAITIPENVTSIGAGAFYGSYGLKSVTMQGSTPPTLDGNNVFSQTEFHSTGKKGIKVPVGTADTYKTAWPDWADYITDGTEVIIVDYGTDWTLDSNGKLTIRSDAGMTDWKRHWYDNYQSVTSVKLEDGVTEIAELAFYRCDSLKSITIPDSVDSIGKSAFKECSALESVTLPENMTSIEIEVFRDCTALTSASLPKNLTKIPFQMFCGCKSLKNITIPDGVTCIDQGAFVECEALESIAIPDGMKEIGDDAFNVCLNLAEVNFPDSVTSIGEFAFAACKKLKSITLPSGVTSIGGAAFSYCESLESVIMQGSTPPTLNTVFKDQDVFEGCKFVTDGTKGIKVPAGAVDAYKTAWYVWADYIAENSAPTGDQAKVEAAKQAVEAALAGMRVSNVTTKESLEAAIKNALKKAGIDDVTISVENFTRTDATTDAPGSISANIKITSGAESVDVPVEKTIAQLPDTPAEKVEAVKSAVEDAVKNAIDTALAGIKVTNDNAEEIAAQIAELIPDAVASALAAAGVSADDIEFGEVGIRIEPADENSEGSIKVTIPVKSTEDAGQSDIAAVQVPIVKSGEGGGSDEDAQQAQKAVEDALNTITVTNETTQEDILAALQEALGEEITVEGIEEFEKEDATEDAPGSLRLKIKLILNGNTIYVTVNVSIPQLGGKTGVYVRFTDYYDLAGSTPRYKYTGTAIKPAVEVYNNETLLTPGKDYTISYKNNTKVGAAAALTVKGKGNFTGTSNVVNFAIIHADIDKDTDHPAEMTVVVNTKVAPVIMNGAKKLTTKDYKLEGEGLVNSKYAAATAEGAFNTLTVKGIGSYEGSSFEIKVKVIERSAAKKLAVTVDKNFKPVYDGSALNLSSLFKQTQDGEGAVTVTDAKDKTKILKEGTDFTVICTSSLTNAGTVKFTVTGMGEYTGSVNKTFKISPLKVSENNKFSVTFDEDKVYEYKASGVTVDNLVVKYLGETDSDMDDEVLTQGVDYKVTYSNNKKVSGTKDAGFKITFLGNYKGSGAVSKTFKVAAAKLSADNTVVTVPDKVYGKANKAYKSTPIVTVDGTTIKSSNYTVSYAWATESEAGDDTKYVTDNKVKITIADGDAWAKVKVTVTPKEAGSYGLAEGAVITGEYYVRRADEATNLTKAKVTFFNKAGTQLKTLEYNGNTFYTPAGNNPKADAAPEDPNAVYVKVTVSGAEVDPDLYDVIWTNATAKGKATVVIRGKGVSTEKGMAVGSKNQAVSIKAMGLKGKNLKSYVEKAVSNLKNIFSLIQ